MIDTTVTNVIVTTSSELNYYTQHSNFLNSISRNVNKLIDFCNSLSDSIYTLYVEVFEEFPPFFVLLVSISAAFTVYYFLRGSR